MKSYRKGYAAENELVHMLYDKGFAVLRAPRSGRVSIPSPDIVALKSSRVLIIECKSHKGGFAVPKEQMEQLREWERRSGGLAYIAWKVAYKGWFFIKLNVVENNRGNVNKRMLAAHGVHFDEFLRSL